LRRVSDRAETAAILHGTDLIGYIAAPEGTIGSASALRSKLREELPDYMVPVDIMRLDSLPRTRNGKINRKALPRPERVPARAEKTLEVPRTPLEIQLAAIWRDVLGINEIGIDDNLFALGADSISVFRIAARMRKEGLGLDAADLMRNPTIARLGRAGGARQESSNASAEAAVPSLRSFRRRAATRE
jgi:aryl carrier-like protein